MIYHNLVSAGHIQEDLLPSLLLPLPKVFHGVFQFLVHSYGYKSAWWPGPHGPGLLDQAQVFGGPEQFRGKAAQAEGRPGPPPASPL